MRTTRTLAALAGLAMLTVSSPFTPQAALAAAPKACPHVGMAVPAGSTSSQVKGTDPTGRFQVGVADVGGKKHALLWDNGKLQDFGAVKRVPTAVNSRGDIVGYEEYAEDNSRPWMRRATTKTFQTLPVPPSEPNVNVEYAPTAVNRSGVAPGTATVIGAGADVGGPSPLIWSYLGVQHLRAPNPYDQFYATDIDDAGTVVGTVVRHEDGDVHAPILETRGIVWYPDGSWKTLQGTSAKLFASVQSIRAGIAVGTQTDDAANKAQIVRWNLNSGKATVLTSGRSGQVNVKASVALNDTNGRTAFFLQKGARRPLLGSVASALVSISEVSDNDVAYGLTELKPGTFRAMRWDCRS